MGSEVSSPSITLNLNPDIISPVTAATLENVKEPIIENSMTLGSSSVATTMTLDSNSEQTFIETKDNKDGPIDSALSISNGQITSLDSLGITLRPWPITPTLSRTVINNTVTSSGTISLAWDQILCSATGNITLQLPPANSSPGKVFSLINTSGTSIVTILRYGTDTINGSTSIAVPVFTGVIGTTIQTITNDGVSKWFI